MHNSFPFTSRRLVFASLDRLLEKIQNSMDRRVRIQARWMGERKRERVKRCKVNERHPVDECLFSTPQTRLVGHQGKKRRTASEGEGRDKRGEKKMQQRALPSNLAALIVNLEIAAPIIKRQQVLDFLNYNAPSEDDDKP